MDPYILTILAKGAGSILSGQATIMDRVLAPYLSEPEVVLHLEFGSIADEDGVRYPIYLEADASSLELYARVGAERESMLVCGREGSRFIVTGGTLFDVAVSDDLL